MQATKRDGPRWSQPFLSISLQAVRVIELFAGIGGLSAACPWLDVVLAIDIDRDARSVYEANFASPFAIRELASIPNSLLREANAELWWMSPPCTPFTRKGNQEDHHDPRTEAFFHLIDLATEILPRFLVIENVVGFENSTTFGKAQQSLIEAGYAIQTMQRCPSSLNWPNKRPRIYSLACLDNTSISNPVSTSFQTADYPKVALKELLDPNVQPDRNPELWLDPVLANRYLNALDRINPEDPDAISACFTSSYGHSMTRSGSYLWQADGWRRFSPREVANLLGFPKEFRLPSHLSNQRLWELLGNSLSIPVVAPLMQFTRYT